MPYFLLNITCFIKMITNTNMILLYLIRNTHFKKFYQCENARDTKLMFFLFTILVNHEKTISLPVILYLRKTLNRCIDKISG